MNLQILTTVVFANKTSHFVASWYRPLGGDLATLDSQLLSFESQLENIKDIHKGNKLPSVHILGDFNFCDIVWPDRLGKSGSPLSLFKGEKFIEILNDHHLEQLVHFPVRERKTLDLIITSLPGQFLDIQSPDRLSDHDMVSGTLNWKYCRLISVFETTAMLKFSNIQYFPLAPFARFKGSLMRL